MNADEDGHSAGGVPSVGGGMGAYANGGGVDPSIRTAWNTTALDEARIRKFDEIVEELLLLLPRARLESSLKTVA